ncbi:MAG TPA: alanine--tRNA ligase, partial [Verrucomicrobiae bacterium]|nr:alanine--tRNA ligase [Verrucomicrobiae bacterium]
MGCECDRFLEIWNLVFMQYNRDEAGELTPLPKQNIDTGMGLERIASVMQGVESNFDTDLLMPIMTRTAEIAGVKYRENPKTDVSLKVIADHLRAVTFMLGDGIRPDNEGRGYVLRRILRRAVRHGKLLGIKEAFLDKVVDVIIGDYGHAYPELRENYEFIVNHLKLEERNFQATLDQGMNILNQFISRLGEQKVLDGKEAFELFATYGFPLEMTEEILAEYGFSVDRDGFAAAMEEHRERARQTFNREGAGDIDQETLVSLAKKLGGTEFVGYGQLSAETKVLALVVQGEAVDKAVAGQEVKIILQTTPFYAESGGQVGDKGSLIWTGGAVEIIATEKVSGTMVVHKGRVISGVMSTGMLLNAQVDETERLSTARNHSATHLLHQALKQVLGKHVNQAGSLVTPSRLRFDFSHFSAVTPEQLDMVEDIVNREILRSLPVEVVETSLDQAKALGAAALFGEKYGDVVRLVSMGEFSHELCGGTHVRSTGEIGFFKILSEGGIGSGLRRIEAVTGETALATVKGESLALVQIAALLKSGKADVVQKVEALVEAIREHEREISHLQQKLARNEVAGL